jgi:hypothetical protein
MNDKNGQAIEIGDDVFVPKPNKSDIHKYEFNGIIDDIIEAKGTVIVEDQDGDFYEIEGNRVEVGG